MSFSGATVPAHSGIFFGEDGRDVPSTLFYE